MRRVWVCAPILAILVVSSLAIGQSQPDTTQQASGGSGESDQPGASRRVLTLAEAVRIALKENPAVQAADDYAEAVEHSIAEARAGRAPRIDFSEGFARGNNPVYVFGSLLTQRQFKAGNFALNQLNAPTPLDNFRTQFAATLALFDAGQVRRKVQDAKLGAQGAAQARQRTRQEVIFNVVRAYLNVLLAHENVRVAEAAVHSADSDRARAQARQDQGLAVPSDLLSAKVQWAQARQDLLQARSAVTLAQAALNVAMGLPEDAPNKVEGGLAEISFEGGTLAQRQQRALARRPDFLEAALGSRRAEIGTRMARAEFLPTLNLFSSWEQDNQTFASRGGSNWTLAANLNFNLFDGGAKRARLAAAHARARQSEALQRQMAAAVQLQVREAYLNLGTAWERVEVSRQARSEAEESLRIIQNRYEAGLATINDLLRAESANSAAQKNYLNVRFDYRISYAALEMATGELAADSPAVIR